MTTLATNSANSVNAASVAASTTASTASSSSASTLTQSDFLQLLTAQLKYQSPTSPANPTQMAQEFAAISTVQGINQINTQLSSIAGANGASQIAQASSLVGRQVAVSGNAIISSSTGKANGAFSLPSAATSANVTVINPNGSIATTLNLGALPAGVQNFSWGGAAANTTYSYDISARCIAIIGESSHGEVLRRQSCASKIERDVRCCSTVTPVHAERGRTAGG